MSTTSQRRTEVKGRSETSAAAARQVVEDQLEEPARQGARQMLMDALSAEVEAYLGRGRYRRDGGPEAGNGVDPRLGRSGLRSGGGLPG